MVRDSQDNYPLAPFTGPIVDLTYGLRTAFGIPLPIIDTEISVQSQDGVLLTQENIRLARERFEQIIKHNPLCNSFRSCPKRTATVIEHEFDHIKAHQEASSQEPEPTPLLGDLVAYSSQYPIGSIISGEYTPVELVSPYVQRAISLAPLHPSRSDYRNADLANKRIAQIEN